MTYSQIIDWLLKGDISIQYQVHRDLLGEERLDLQKRITTKGWGKQFLSKRHKEGQWGKAFYQPKWTSSHYTLMDLRNLCIAPNYPLVQESIKLVLENKKAEDGGISLGPSTQNHSDVCVNGMFLNYSSYFQTNENELKSVVDCILNQKMADGGFNCRSNRGKPRHSSLHTTLSVLEGFSEYEMNGCTYRITELKKAMDSAKEFILIHQLYISDRTGNIINKDFIRFSYPRRWRYDILSALDYFQYSKTPWDNRMQLAIDLLLKKRTKNGTWNLNAKHPGQTHFDMEKAGQPSRWNTLRALRILKFFDIIQT